MKFDVIIGNPPYQLSDGSGGSTDASAPIYQKFIQAAIALNPKYVVMIVPSKWMIGGRAELNAFRKTFMNDKHLSIMVDYENEKDCFPGVHIDGGVNYFLWGRNHNGPLDYTYIKKDGTVLHSIRNLKNNYFDYVIRDTRIISILDKLNLSQNFSSIVSSTKPFGVRKYLFNDPTRYPDSNLSEKYFKNSVKIYGVKGIKGGAKRTFGYVTKETITSNLDALDKYNIFFTTSYSTGAYNPPAPILSIPGEACTETFLLIGPFNSKRQQENCYAYMNTNFFKFLLFHGKGTMQVNKKVFSLIPLVDFNETWTDEKLFNKFNLSSDEINLILTLQEGITIKTVEMDGEDE